MLLRRRCRGGGLVRQTARRQRGRLLLRPSRHRRRCGNYALFAEVMSATPNLLLSEFHFSHCAANASDTERRRGNLSASINGHMSRLKEAVIAGRRGAFSCAFILISISTGLLSTATLISPRSECKCKGMSPVFLRFLWGNSELDSPV